MLIAWIGIMWVAAMVLSAWAESELEETAAWAWKVQGKEPGRDD